MEEEEEEGYHDPCILCGVWCGGVEKKGWKKRGSMEVWGDRAATSLSHLLLGPGGGDRWEEVEMIFSKGTYCPPCRTHLWDVDTISRMVERLQTRLHSLSNLIFIQLTTNLQRRGWGDECRDQGEERPYNNSLAILKNALESAGLYSSQIELKEVEKVECGAGGGSSNIKERLRRGPHPKPPTPPLSSTSITKGKGSVDEGSLLQQLPIIIKQELPEDCSNDDHILLEDYWVEGGGGEEEDEIHALFGLSISSTNKPVKTLNKTRKRPKKNKPKSQVLNPKTIPCSESPSCRYKFYSDFTMQVHVRRDHKKDPNPYQCPQCDRYFNQLSNLKTHIRRHSQTFTINCDLCGKGFHSRHTHNLHMEGQHSAQTYPHECLLCTKGFSTVEQLSTHSEIHEGKTPFTCEDCNEAFANSSELRAHVSQVHSRPCMPTCTFCNKSFRTAFYLKNHVKQIHVGLSGTVLKCRKCGMEFEQFKDLRQHRQDVHLGGPKVYQCDQCGVSFGYRKGLTYHMRSHTGEKPYECKICGRAFKQKSHCNKHEIGHSGLKNFICSICGKAYANKDNLRAHEKQVHERVKKRDLLLLQQTTSPTSSTGSNPKKRRDPPESSWIEGVAVGVEEGVLDLHVSTGVMSTSLNSSLTPATSPTPKHELQIQRTEMIEDPKGLHFLVNHGISQPQPLANHKHPIHLFNVRQESSAGELQPLVGWNGINY